MPSSIWTEFVSIQNKETVGSAIVFSLLKQVSPVEITDEKIVLSCDSDGARKYLHGRKNTIEDLLSDFTQRKMTVEFVVEVKKKKKEQAAPLFDFRPSVEDIFTKSGLNPKYKFENFAVSSSNQVAYAAAQAVANSPGNAYNPLFLYGGVGVGKTHIAQAAARIIIEKQKDKQVYFCPGDQFTNELIDSIREKSTAKFRRKYRNLSLIIVDDIQFIAGKTSVQEEFFHTFNSIASGGGQIILTSDRPPSEIKNLEDRLRSRFSGGLIVDIQAPDFELRTAILLIKAKEKGIEIDMDSARVIAESIEDTRALEGTLLSIYAKVLGHGEKITLDVVDDYFTERSERPRSKKITPHEIIKTVCSFYNVKQSHIKSGGRTNEVALARQIIMYILREVYELKLNEVAMILKKKDHTTVMHGTDKIKRLLMKDTTFKKEIDTIVSSLNAST